MDRDEIKKIDRWFDKHKYGSTYRVNEKRGQWLYSVEADDVEEFCSFIEQEFTDIVGIPCLLGQDSLWFRTEDLKQVDFI